MRRTTLFLTVALVMALVFASPALAAPGDLDPSFGGDGKVTTNFTSSNDIVNDVAIQPDGKVVVAGGAGESPSNFGLARYNADGSPDTSFDSDGKLTTAFDPTFTYDEAYAVAIQPDGKIVTAGTHKGSSFALARYNPDGSLDTTFDSDGMLTHQVYPPPQEGVVTRARAYDVAVQQDGKIVAAGFAENPTTAFEEFALVRFNADGSLDTSFDGDGKVATTFSTYGVDHARAVAIQPDGKIVAAGYSERDFARDFALARYNSDGSLDTTFSSDGKVTTANIGEVNTLALQQDGKIVVVGGDSYATLARYTSSGSLDGSFSGDGKVTTGVAAGSGIGPQGPGLAIQQDGKIVVGAYDTSHNANTGIDFGIERYNSDGSPDTLFSGDGKASTDFDAGPDFPRALAIQPDGKIVAAGASYGSSANAHRFGVTRYFGGDDATPTSPVTNLNASVLNRDVTLSWTNPTDEDFTATKILRSTSSYATSPSQSTSQTKIYEGSAATLTDPSLPNANYYYTAFASDDNGNWSVAAKVRVDLMPPNTTITSGPSGFVRSTSASFGFSSSETGSTFQCSLDGAPYSGCTSTMRYPSLADGLHTFRVRATDSSGNTDPTPDIQSWTIDTVAPRGTILINGGASTTRSRSVTLRLSANDPSPASGVATMRFSNDGTTWTGWQAYATSKSWTLSSGTGTKAVYVQYQDRAGNISAAVRDTISYSP